MIKDDKYYFDLINKIKIKRKRINGFWNIPEPIKKNEKIILPQINISFSIKINSI